MNATISRRNSPPRPARAECRRIVFVGNFALWHKATMSDRTLPMAYELRRAGHEVLIVVPPWDAPARAGAIERHWGVPIVNTRLADGLARQPGAALAVARAALSVHPDTVVAVKPIAHAGLIALGLGALGRKGQRPIELVVDSDDWEGTGGWMSQSSAPGPVRSAVALHERLVLRAADRVLAASRAIETLALGVGVERQRLSYVPNAAWPGSAGWPAGNGARGRARLGLGGGRLLLLYSRLFEVDPARLAAVLARVLEAVADARVLIVGAGLHGEELPLRSALAGAGLADRVVMAGWLERAVLPDVLAAADAALVPLEDTLVNRARCSVKLIDLMLAGRAIVADAVGQVPEYLVDGVTGRLVRDGDPAAMASAAIEVLAHPETARRLGDAAARAVRERFTWRGQGARLTQAILG